MSKQFVGYNMKHQLDQAIQENQEILEWHLQVIQSSKQPTTNNQQPTTKFLAAQNTVFQWLEPSHCSVGAPISETLYSVQRGIWFLVIFAKLTVSRPSILKQKIKPLEDMISPWRI